MVVQLLTEHHLECLSLEGGCIGSSESTLVNMQQCWISSVAAQLCYTMSTIVGLVVARLYWSLIEY